jgi:dihydrofolate reductase
MELVIIAAVSENNVIGKDGKLPWHIPEDLKRFKELTLNHSVVMGRKTFESIGKALPDRINVVVTRDTSYQPVDVVVVHSFEEAIKMCKNYEKTFVIGGQSVFAEAMPLADRLEITEVHKEVDGDTYFPEFDRNDWVETSREDHDEYSFVTYVRAK